MCVCVRQVRLTLQHVKGPNWNIKTVVLKSFGPKHSNISPLCLICFHLQSVILLFAPSPDWISSFSFSPPSAATHLYTWRHYSFTLTSSFPLVFLLVVYSLLLMLPWWTCKWLNAGFVWLRDGMFSSEENNTNDLKCCDFAVYRTYKVWPCVYEVQVFSD